MTKYRLFVALLKVARSLRVNRFPLVSVIDMYAAAVALE